MKRTLVITLLFILISPWFNTLRANQEIIFPYSPGHKIVAQEKLLDKTNSLRGELLNANITPLISKLIINKYTVQSFYFADIYLQSFDPHFLFFSGTNDVATNTGFNGPLYLAFLPMFIYGLFKTNKFVKLFLAISPFPVLLYYAPQELVPLRLFFILFSYVCAIGFVNIRKKNKKLFIVLFVFLIFEVLKFRHVFLSHYPAELFILLNS